MIHLSETRKITARRDLVIPCPVCNQGETPAFAFDAEHRVHFMFFIPIWRYQRSGVVCEACKTQFLTRLGADELSTIPPGELAQLIIHAPRNMAFVYNFLAVAAILLCCIPVVSLVMALASFMGNRRAGPVPRNLSDAAVVVSGIANLGWLLFFLFAAILSLFP